jgi:hypothetical protein
MPRIGVKFALKILSRSEAIPQKSQDTLGLQICIRVLGVERDSGKSRESTLSERVIHIDLNLCDFEVFRGPGCPF